MYAVDFFRQKAEVVIGDVGVPDGYAVNCLFPCMGGVLSVQEGGGGAAMCVGPQ